MEWGVGVGWGGVDRIEYINSVSSTPITLVKVGAEVRAKLDNKNQI